LKLTKLQQVAFKKKRGSLARLLKCYHGVNELKILRDVANTMKTSCPLFLKSSGETVYNMLFSRINAYSVEVADFFNSVRNDIEGLVAAGSFTTNPSMVDLWVMKLAVFAREAEREKGLEYMAAVKEMFKSLICLHESKQLHIRRRTIGVLLSAAKHLDDRLFAEELLQISLRLEIKLRAEDIAALIHLTKEVHNNLKLMETHCVEPPEADLISSVSEILAPSHDIYSNCSPELDGRFSDEGVPATIANIPSFSLTIEQRDRCIEKIIKDHVGPKKKNSKHWHQFEKFKNSIEQDGGAEAVIDGANVMHYGQRQGILSYGQLDRLIRSLEDEGLKVRVVLSRWRANVKDASAASCVNRWKKDGKLYISPTGFDDDFCWLWIALYSTKFFSKTYIITNDLMKDFAWDLHEYPFFFHWLHSTLVRFRTRKDKDITLDREDIEKMREEKSKELEHEEDEKGKQTLPCQSQEALRKASQIEQEGVQPAEMPANEDIQEQALANHKAQEQRTEVLTNEEPKKEHDESLKNDEPKVQLVQVDLSKDKGDIVVAPTCLEQPESSSISPGEKRKEIDLNEERAAKRIKTDDGELADGNDASKKLDSQANLSGEISIKPSVTAQLADESTSQVSEKPTRSPSPPLNLLKKKRHPTHCAQKYETGHLTIKKGGGQSLILYWPFDYAIKVHQVENGWYLPSIRRLANGTIECSGWPYVDHEEYHAQLGVVFNTMLPTKDKLVPLIPPLPYQIADRILWTLFVPKNSISK